MNEDKREEKEKSTIVLTGRTCNKELADAKANRFVLELSRFRNVPLLPPRGIPETAKTMT